MTELEKIGAIAKEASYKLTNCNLKDKALEEISKALIENAETILLANESDLENAKKSGMSEAMQDRLRLSHERIREIANGVLKVRDLDDPIGEIIEMWKRPNGLTIGTKRVPIGVIAIIYEARPNVTVDAAVLCLKTSNAVILRGGSEAINSNVAIMRIMQKAAYSVGIPEGSLNIVEDTSREVATELMKLNGYVDLLIPRGGRGLIKSVVENATVPVIETAAGNCHVYVDSDADFEMARKIIINAKVSRPSVCNACEKLLIDKSCLNEFLPVIVKGLRDNNVLVKGCEECRKIIDDLEIATEDDWYEEYNDYIISIKAVCGIDDAIRHINKYNTRHSEAIITKDYEKTQKFLNEVDAACVYVNASTRFTDGFEFGFGAEIGISTQKIHARGPMGLKQLTSIKYIILGNGQIR